MPFNLHDQLNIGADMGYAKGKWCLLTGLQKRRGIRIGILELTTIVKPSVSIRREYRTGIVIVARTS